MILYVSLFIFFVGGLSLSNRKGIAQFWLILSGITLSLLVGFRGETVGIDTAAYFNIYDIIKYMPDNTYISEKIQPFYVFLNKISDFFNGGPSLTLFFAAAITLYLLLSTILRFSTNISLSLAIFFSLELFFFMHNVVRQAIAVSIVFYSIRYIISRQLLLFLIMIFIASMFHISAIIFLPFYFIAGLGINYICLILAWLTSLAFLIDSSLISLLFGEITPYLPAQYEYFANREDVLVENSQSLGLTQMFKQIVFILLIYVYPKIKASRNNSTVLLLALISIILSNIFYHIGLINRINSYFSIFLILALPLAIDYAFERYSKIIVNISLYVAFFIIYVRNLFTDGHSIFPYYNVLF